MDHCVQCILMGSVLCAHSVDNQLKYAKTQLDRLKKTNVFNTTFHIWFVHSANCCVSRVF